MAAPSNPQKPSLEERNNYYFGFAGQPKLVARTSLTPWIKKFTTIESWQDEISVPLRKEYRTIGHDHPITSKWSSSLVDGIIKSLRDSSWSFFFPIRIDFANAGGPNGFPIILLIAVEKDTLSWEVGISIALECRSVLRAHDILNIEVEIQEGHCHDLAASTELDRLVDHALDHEEINQILHPLLSSPGHAVSHAYNGKDKQGTIGLHVKLDGDESIYGLTCRHVVNRGRPARYGYKFSKDTKPQYYIQANQTTFYDCQYFLEGRIKELGGGLNDFLDCKRRWDEFEHLDESKAHLCPTEESLAASEVCKTTLAYAKSFVEPLERIHDPITRTIGQLMFHPPMEFSKYQKGYLKDWALIKLDREKFSENPLNSAYCGDGFESRIGFALRRFMSVSPLKSYSTPLFIPYIANWRANTVYKVGASTGLTEGRLNGIQAVIRKPADLDGHHYAWQMVVIPPKGGGRFSNNGDSGSSVYTPMGRIVGILTSSGSEGVWPEDGRRRHPGANISPRRVNPSNDKKAEAADEMDITFVDPIQWVLDDIERFTSRKVELA
ncbi:hypothetical protein F4805DRAFT_474605 [Annulohypoxylon moriforme]|nr:hypothetical protein F4805DRAFT_474605 [Annulohypoxylon moriforme]